MNILPRPLRKEIHSYYSTKSLADFKKDLDNLFNKKWYDLSINLDGEFTNENEFSVTKKITFVHSTNGNSYTKLKGKIYADQNKTRLDLTIKPNPAVYIIVFITPIWGLIALYAAFFHPKNNFSETLLIGLIMTFIIPVVSAFLGQFAKNNLRKKFADTFKLTEV